MGGTGREFNEALKGRKVECNIGEGIVREVCGAGKLTEEVWRKIINELCDSRNADVLMIFCPPFVQLREIPGCQLLRIQR